MCSRYAFSRGLGQLRRVVRINRVNTNGHQFNPSNNIAPGSIAPVVSNQEIMLLSWGTQILTNTVINARSETVLTKFKKDISDRRCVVPADGYFEWNQDKQPYFFHNLNKDDMMFLAAFYNERGEFVILTREASKQVAKIHKRMPIILTIQQIEIWEGQNWNSILSDNSPKISFYPVSRLSLRHGYTGIECITPIKIEGKVQISLLDMLKQNENKIKIEEIKDDSNQKQKTDDIKSKKE